MAKKRPLTVNSSPAPLKRVHVQCTTRVERSAVSRRSIDGVEHIVITSRTLPDNIVMNGGLYSAEEIEKSFRSLERTLAPVEHPTDAQGNYISATDPAAIHNFYAGAFNENVRREDGRVVVDKVISVQEALKTDRGKRLLDRVGELETNDDPRPIHTSVGVFCDVKEFAEPQTNAEGQEYTWVALNMLFDHDAILLDSVGAAQPHQGVGMAVNRDGEEVKAEEFVLSDEVLDQPDEIVEMSHEELREKLREVLNTPPLSADWIERVFDDNVIYELNEQLFSVPYRVDGDQVTIIGIPTPMDRDLVYTPKTNQKGDAMKELMLSALAAAGITVNADISDDELLKKYNELMANQGSGDGDDAGDGGATGVAEAVANALKPVTDKLDSLEAKFNEKDTAEVDRLAEIVGNSDKYPGIDVDTAKALGHDKLKELSANCAPAHGIPLTVVNGGKQDGEQSFEMPK